ncbi:molybdenum cofactor guanylyltransferase [Sphingobium sp.]|uniref:molybdenum cofactor guanylyltransferase n=1 Tax=Sphingobium sp. TaxID=1912891 RepID=UPI003B3A18CC
MQGIGRILGAVLAGGRSSRFGTDKALARLTDGRMLIDHVTASLSPHVAALVICGRSGGLADRPRPDMGPLGGLNAALHHALAHGFAGVLTTGCDMPVYPEALPAALIGPDAAIVQDQPLLGWWPASLAPDLDTHLDCQDDRSIRRWAIAIGARLITLRNLDLANLDLPNINRPEDLAAWDRPA